MAEAATVCLNEQGHSPGVAMRVQGSYRSRFRVVWRDLSEQMMRSWADPDFATEQGAYGIAALLVEALTDLTVVERSRKGTGFDYWLGPVSSESLFFQAKARLEVSGIRRGDLRAVRARVRQKIEQTRKSDGRLPAFIIVVEFSRPQSRVIER